MKVLLKNYLLQNKIVCTIINKQSRLSVYLILFISLNLRAQQIVNYVNNGGFEEIVPDMYLYPKFWGGLDTTKPWGVLHSSIFFPYNVPSSSHGYQWPRHGNNFLGTGLFDVTGNPNLRGYPRNRLKQPLDAGKVYCVSFFVNLTNQSTYGIDAIGVYFADSSLDTIQLSNNALTYLSPQIQNPTNSVILDTLNWILISGQYTANGTEKYLLIGNFKSDANTITTLVNPVNLPANFADYNIDDVSVIERDILAYAGPDQAVLPGDSVFIGRQSDVGIDEVCQWYKLPTVITPTTPAIDTIAGMWVKPIVTTTYVVKQQLPCSTVKWDTVVVHQTAVGIEKFNLIQNDLRLFPNPAQDILQLQFTVDVENEFKAINIYNNLGQLLREEDLIFKNKTGSIKTDDLANGVYVLKLSDKTQTVSKRFIINR